MLNRIARLVITEPRRVLILALLVLAATAVWGIPAIAALSGGGETDPGAQSSRAAALLSQKFGQADAGLLITVTSADGAQGPKAKAVGTDLVTRLQHSANVGQVRSPWTVPADAASALISKDGKTGLITADISGSEIDAQVTAENLADQLVHDRDGVIVRAGGGAIVSAQVNAQTQDDLLFMESLALPLSFIVLVWVFGGLVAAALPVAVGVFAILGALASLHGIALFTDVSIFALNLSVALGMALAVDYTLLILSRFRDELAMGYSREVALRRTITTAGRTVLFSALTVGLAMATLVLFPQYFLKSFGYAGVAVVAFAAAASIVVTPAAIVLLGSRLDALDARPLLRKLMWGRHHQAGGAPGRSWYRWTKVVMRHAVPIGIAVTAVLLLLGAPFLDVRWGFADDRILPTSASARQVGDQLRNNFAAKDIPDVTAVLPDAKGLSAADLDAYAAALSRVPDVPWVSAPGGTFVGGTRSAPTSAPAEIKDGSAFLTVGTSAPLYSAASLTQLDRLHAVPTPAGRAVWLAGAAQGNRDSVQAISSRLPLVLTLIAIITLTLVFLLTGSVVLPVKAVLLNVLSLSAAFGALVWVFQQGHLGGLGTAATGTLGVELPVLLFCIAFGLSMDYEVFLISRIREYWLASDRGAGANDESVALGLSHTARVITAAAAIMTISFAALMAAQVSFMRLFGFGLTVAVLADATLVRMLLVPAFMHVLGRINWWAPKPLARLHDRFGLGEGSDSTHGDSTQGPARDLAQEFRMEDTTIRQAVVGSVADVDKTDVLNLNDLDATTRKLPVWRAGRVFAGYTIERDLGSGGMGEVYLATHPRLPRHDALKVLPPDLSADPEYRARFDREADLAAGLSHPNIVRIHDRGVADGQFWISMAYVDGTDAARLLRERFPNGMPLQDVVPIIAAVSSALDYAHYRGLLHRDVKPANILLADPDGQPRRIYLADFGVARRIDDATGLTATNTTMGTVNYAAPEQLRGAPLDGRADQYALACTTFHLLTGVPPYADPNPAAVIAAHLTAAPPAIGPRRPELSALQSVFATAMAKDPARRFGSCGEFATRLAQQLTPGFAYAGEIPYHPVDFPYTQPAGLPVPVPPQSPPTSSSGGGRSHRFAWAGAMGCVALLIAGGVYVGVNREDHPTPAATAPETSAASASPTPAPNAGPLTGVYTVEYTTATGLDGATDRRMAPSSETWNIRSECGAAGCVATASRASGDSMKAPQMTLDQIDGRWVAVNIGSSVCGKAEGEVWETFTLEPHPDGTLSGEVTQSMPVGCTNKRTATFTRTSDIDANILAGLPDPAKLPPFVSSPAKAMVGRYHQLSTQPNGFKSQTDWVARTDCLRTGDRCMTLLHAPPAKGMSLMFANGSWLYGPAYDAQCWKGGVMHVQINVPFPLPQPSQDPITALSGHGREELTGSACPSTDVDVRLTRTGD